MHELEPIARHEMEELHHPHRGSPLQARHEANALHTLLHVPLTNAPPPEEQSNDEDEGGMGREELVHSC